MEFADSLRNKLFNPSNRQLFTSTDAERFIEIITMLISYMETLLLAYNKLETSSFELKTNLEDFDFAENVIEKNLWSRQLKPDFERKYYATTEYSISQVS